MPTDSEDVKAVGWPLRLWPLLRPVLPPAPTAPGGRSWLECFYRSTLWKGLYIKIKELGSINYPTLCDSKCHRLAKTRDARSLAVWGRSKIKVAAALLSPKAPLRGL